MARLDIGGRKVAVDDSFLKLSPEQQQATVDEIAASFGPTEKQSSSKADGAIDTIKDVAKSAGTGVVKGAIGLAGLPDLGQKLVTGAMDYLTGKKGPEVPTISPSVEGMTSALESQTGKLYEPQTRAGRYAQTAGEFAPGALAGPGGIIPKLAKYAVIPGLASEGAGEATAGTAAEPYARVAGALAGVGAGAGAGALVGGVKNRLATGSTAKDIAQILGEPVNAGAVRRVAGSAAEDKLTVPGATARAAELGPDETMVLDLGRQLGGRAEAIASQPGRGQNVVLDAVEGRTGQFGSGTADRVRQTLDQEMGRSPNVVDLKDRVAQIVDSQAKPLYDKVMEAHPVLSVPAAITERPVVAQAMKDAVSLAKNYGEKLATKETNTILSGPGYHIADDVTLPAKTSLRYWDYVKKSMDSRINGMMRKGGIEDLNSAEKADLGGLLDAKKALVAHLDDVTKGAYKQARQVAATKPQLNEALEFGQSSFNSKLLPEEFAAQLSDMSLPQQTMVKAGFRRELDRLIENTRNEGATARRLLDTNSVLQKAETLFGPQAAREIERRIGAETSFQDTTQKIAQDSRTAVRQELRKDTATPSTGDVGGLTLPGMAAMAGRGGINYIRNQGMSRTREGIGSILTASGDKRDDIVKMLLELNQKRASNSAVSGSAKAAAIANMLNASQQGRQ